MSAAALYRVRVALALPGGGQAAPGDRLTLTPQQAHYWLAAGKIEPAPPAPPKKPQRRRPSHG